MQLQTRDEYYKQRRLGSATDECAFCKAEQIILGETTNWLWVASSAPYWKYHTMLLPKRHIVEIHEINDDEWTELKQLEKTIVRIYKSANIISETNGVKLENVLVLFRQRLNQYNAVQGTAHLDHLHLHFTFDRDDFLDPTSDSDASSWDVNIFKNTL